MTEQGRTSQRRYREFGFVLALILAALGLYPMAGNAVPGWWMLAVAAAVALIAAVRPSLLKHPYRIMLKVGRALGWVNTRLLLTLVFFVVILPTSLVMRMLGKRPLDTGYDTSPGTYWSKREAGGGKQNYDRMF